MESNAERDQLFMTVLEAAREQPPEERRSFLQQACPGDHDLLRELEEALDGEERMGGFLQTPLIAFKELERPFDAGQVIAERFEIIREIGEGGMGVLYEAFDRKRNHRIAIKSAKLGFRRLLTPELEGALKVRHPNICLVNEIHSAQTRGGEVDFLTMELLEGETLHAHLQARGKLPSGEAMEIACQICAGLSEAHRNGIIHRDLKSGNVMLCRAADGNRRAVIMDFGLAGESRDSTEPAGTPQYMGPELWRGEKTSKASDVYALGVILYEMVAGRKPFAAGTIESTRSSPPAPPSASVKEFGAQWDRAVLPCLDPDPERRPEACEVLARLRSRARSRVPLYVAAGLLAMLGIGAAIPGVREPVLQRIHPANVRLAVLPFEGSADAAVMGGGLLLDAAERIRRLRTGSATVVVISPTEAAAAGIHKPEQARTILHATHALESMLRQEGQDWVANGAVIDLTTKLRLREFSARYPPAHVTALPLALAGAVSLALRLRGGAAEEPMAPAAATPYFQGLYYLRRDRGSFDLATPLFEEAARLDPRSPLPRAGMAEAQITGYQITKDPRVLEDARRSVEAAQSRNPDSVPVLLVAGLLEQTASRYEIALEYYRRVQEREPRNTDAWRRMAGVYDLMNIRDKAVQAFRKAIELEPGYYAAYSELGVFYYFHGNYPEAAAEFRNTIDRAPGAVTSYTNLGAVMSDLGRYGEAEQALLQSLEIRETPAALNSLGVVRAQQKRDAEAAGFYERAIAIDPRNDIYLLNLGDCYRRLGRKADATGAYRRAMDLALAELQQDPRQGWTRAFVAYFAAMLGDQGRAEVEMVQARQLSPGDARVIRRAVLMYELLGQRERALAALSGSTPELLQEISRHPDLADFCRDSRFQQLTGKAGIHNGGR